MKFLPFRNALNILTLSIILVGCGSSIQMVEQQVAKTITDDRKVKPVAISKVVSKIRRGTKIGIFRSASSALTKVS